MLSYKRFWKMLRDRSISQYRLIHTYHISPDRLQALRKNQYVRTSLIASLCQILHCHPAALFTSLAEEDAADFTANTEGLQVATAKTKVNAALSYAPLFERLAHCGKAPNELIAASVIDARTLSRLRQNRPTSLYTLERIGAFLGCGAEVLFTVQLASASPISISPV